MQYGYISGYPKFRHSLARFLETGYGKRELCRKLLSYFPLPRVVRVAAVDPELLFATNGISGGLGLLCSLLAGRGDTVIVENPSYFLALSIFRSVRLVMVWSALCVAVCAALLRDFGLNIVAVDVDAEGLRTDDLEVWRWPETEKEVLRLTPHTASRSLRSLIRRSYSAAVCAPSSSTASQPSPTPRR